MAAFARAPRTRVRWQVSCTMLPIARNLEPITNSAARYPTMPAAGVHASKRELHPAAPIHSPA
jgi:hypothetical protein